jgi:hypothetical protein
MMIIVFIGADRIEMRLRQVAAQMKWFESCFKHTGKVPPHYVDQYLDLMDENEKLKFAMEKRQRKT